MFAQGLEGCMLVGGTALAGYYAGHRRSDDLELFVSDPGAHRAAVLAVESLSQRGTSLTARQRTPQFFDAVCNLEHHAFTVQVVLDANLFRIGKALRVLDGVWVAELPTLLKQKCATLVSRCSEKDLYDVGWLIRQFPEVTPAQVVTLGSEVDAGMTAEAALLSVVGASLRKSACDFSFDAKPEAVFEEVLGVRDALAKGFDALARRQPLGPLEQLIRALTLRKP